MNVEEQAAYQRLIELIERDLSLAGEGRFEELAAADAERQELVRTLPATPPEGARDLLERASLVQKRLTIELLRGRAELLAAAGVLERGRRTARGYAPPRRRSPQVVESA